MLKVAGLLVVTALLLAAVVQLGVLHGRNRRGLEPQGPTATLQIWLGDMADVVTDAVLTATGAAFDSGLLRPEPTDLSEDPSPTGLPYQHPSEGRLGRVNPEPLAPGEVPRDILERLVRNYNPAMIHRGPDIWAVEVDYLWADGSPLVRKEVEVGLTGVLRVVEGSAVEVMPADQLRDVPWPEPPPPADARREYVYTIDGPGENYGPDLREASWITRWRRIQGVKGLVDPSRAPYPPTQYAHVFWLDQERDLLCLQYWFFYPYNKFINNHEGDFEHINVILQLEEAPEGSAVGGGGGVGAHDRFDPVVGNMRPVEYHYFAHGAGYAHFENVVRIGGHEEDSTGDHPVVFAGGLGGLKMDGDGVVWSGEYSGASWPAPALYRGVSFPMASEDTRGWRRAIHAEDFQVVLLDEPDRIDYGENPHLSWLRLPFRAGRLETEANARLIRLTGGHLAPRQPALGRHWGQGLVEEPIPLRSISTVPFRPPSSWRVLWNPYEAPL